jgi:hypothetical protein
MQYFHDYCIKNTGLNLKIRPLSFTRFKYTLISEGNHGLAKLHFYFIIQNTKRHT